MITIYIHFKVMSFCGLNQSIHLFHARFMYNITHVLFSFQFSIHKNVIKFYLCLAKYVIHSFPENIIEEFFKSSLTERFRRQHITSFMCPMIYLLLFYLHLWLLCARAENLFISRASYHCQFY